MATRTALCRMDGAWTRTDEGYLDSGVKPTKAGVFNYITKDGKVRRELRPRSEVHKADSLRTLENRPHTNSHPPMLLKSTNVKRYKTGTVYGKHEVDDDNLHTKARVLVMDADTIKDIESGKEQVSCGYTCDLDETPGIDPEFGAYDAIQTNIRYNHLASEWRGRAGSGARLTRDADDLPDDARFDAWEVDDDDPEPLTQIKTDTQTKEIPMIKMDVDGKTIEVNEVGEVVLSTKFKADAAAIVAAEAQATAAKAEATQARADADALQAKLDAAAERLAAFDKQQEAARLDALKTRLTPILGKDYAFEGKSEAALNAAALAKAKPTLKLDGLSADYIAARLDAALEVVPGRSVMDAYDAAGSTTRTDAVDPIDAAYQKQIAALTGAKE